MWPDCSGPHCRLTVYFLREQWIVIFFFFFIFTKKVSRWQVLAQGGNVLRGYG